jgi:hypothetical protein
MAWGLSLLAVFMMWMMWAMVFMHQMYPLVQPVLNQEAMHANLAAGAGH